MALTLICSKSCPPIGGLAAVELIKEHYPITIEWSDENKVIIPSGGKLENATGNDVLRAIARYGIKSNLYGQTAIEMTQVDHWLTFCLTCSQDLGQSLSYLQRSLGALTYLVANKLTIADLALHNELFSNMEAIKKIGIPNHVQRWYNLMSAQECIIKSLQLVHKLGLNVKKVVANAKTGERKQEGKFVDLPGAEIGKVIVRFPPEASGFLHIGHAKAALLNQYYQQAFNGKLIMRFDDTNPAKENAYFEQVILEDLKMLEVKPDMFTHTSQYFDLMLEYCEKLMKEGKAYVDDTDAETMKKEREQKIESKNRTNTIEKNLSMWKEMVAGSDLGRQYCVRAKIDMQSPNGCMRDPTIYRCKNEPHPRTGTKYKVYPTYDFACPIVDAIENVTHTLRTTEYHDRDDQFYWFIDALKLRKPYIWAYSRLNMTNTVLSKRKLTWFVDNRIVDGWDDPRFPTVRGILRRGMTVEGLKQFIIAQGSSKSIVFMEWDKIWAINKKVIDPIAPRYTAVSPEYVVVNVMGGNAGVLRVPAHPKNPDVGDKDIDIGPKIRIDYIDAETLKENENATFINWGNIMINKINKDKIGKITSIDGTLNLDNKDFKNTVKLTWLRHFDDEDKYTPTKCVYFDHIINKAILGKDEDFKTYIGHQTKFENEMVGDPELRKCKKGDIIQLQRRGFFKVDEAFVERSPFTGVYAPIVLFAIPDGHTKENPTAGGPKKAETSSKNDKKNEPQVVSTSTTTAAVSALDLHKKIVEQGNTVRNLKSQKSEKAKVDEQIKLLLDLKNQFKKEFNIDWKPDIQLGNLTVPKSSSGLSASDLDNKIISQGNIVRQLKTDKAPKPQVEEAVKVLLQLKTEYKTSTGSEWKPGSTSTQVPSAIQSASDIDQKIVNQGDLVRKLKSDKAPKNEIDSAVKVLLQLKSDYKKQTGSDWKPSTTNLNSDVKAVGSSKESADSISQKISLQGDKIRDLKAKKSDKSIIEAEVKILLAIKSDYKSVTGKDWKPETPTTTPKVVKEQLQPKKIESTNMNAEQTEFLAKVTAQGELVRELKSKKAVKNEIDEAVKQLLQLKADFKTKFGIDVPAPANARSSGNKENKQKPKAEVAPKQPKPAPVPKEGAKKQTRLGLEAKKETNLPDWYSQIIVKGELIEYYDVSGCYILRPWSFAIWKVIKEWFDKRITDMGVKECYFPIFVSRAALEKEKTHIADFAPEVAWVTKSGESDLAEPIAVRPTSETVMYPAYAKWIQSHRDLPLRLNQWSNVVRWEFKHPQPFLRTREFLWQEGHTAFATAKEAQEEVLDILELYAGIYTELLAIPVVRGRKTEKEKFAGGDYTTTVEAFISASGRAIQGATSHHLGQNFSKMFDIVIEDPVTLEKQFVYQNSWGLTTRTIGVMIMVHADNQGLVLPPRVACIQVIIVPCGITNSLKEEDRLNLLKSCSDFEKELKSAGVKAEGDFRDNYSPGWKFNHWELKGVPIRIELGPKDLKSDQFVAVRRDTGEKITLPRADAKTSVPDLLEKIHFSMLQKATNDLNEHKKLTRDWNEFCAHLDKKNIILSPFCGEMDCEERIKADSAKDVADAEPGAPAMGAKSLCIPFEQPEQLKDSDKCVYPSCKNKPKFFTLFGRSY